MTSNPPAQPRPPPPAPLITGWTRQRSFSTLPTSRRASIPALSSLDAIEDAHTVLDQDGRPAKRRKVESHASSPSSATVPGLAEDDLDRNALPTARKYVNASWVTAWSGRLNNPTPSEAKLKNALPLPPTPWSGQVGELPPIRVRTSCRYRLDVTVPNVPDFLQSPTSAPMLESKKPADYFPWTGKHAEDIINESNVKSGYCDRPPPSAERESNTAKAPLYNAFKHRSGLESLSALFTLVLDQKSKHAILSSASTFRPPPRVTLTEVKRKSWIAELADGNVPLRRLSRTIPQGIRGLSLLEQCLTNNVPINRAVWFVKCVGANEIRTLKRKGANATITAGAENKWLKDWTTNIEQFLDTAVGQCGSEKWSDNLTYTLQLCTRLYLENLLDRDHFLDWLVKNFANCSLDLLATWLPVVQIFRLDLTRFRRRARQLAGAFVSRLKDLSDLNSTGSPLLDRLRNSVRGLLSRKPACFLMPNQWRSYCDTLRSCFDFSSETERRLYDYIERRNERMMGSAQGGNYTPDLEKSVFELLDNASAPFNMGELSDQISALSDDFSKLSNLCLEWAISRFRGGQFRIYLVARLLRRWQRTGADIDSTLLAFFSQQQDGVLINLGSYRHLFAELSRSRTFSSSQFLQKVSIQGPTVQQMTSKPTQDCSFLLRDLCLQDSEEHMLHLRSHLLKRQVSAVTENETETLRESIAYALFNAESDDTILALGHGDWQLLKQLDWSSKFEISNWLRTEAIELSKLAAVEIPGKPSLPGSTPLRLGQFLLMREVLEVVGDIAVLADVLHILSSTKQESILAALVDTVHCNASALSAIGALESLQKLFGQAYINLRAGRPCILLLATSLTDLCLRFPCNTTPVRALQQDLIRGDRGRALAACSPFSDGVAESLQQAGATFIDDFEAILQGEPNMSEQTMTSLFTVLIGRIMKSDTDTPGQSLFTLCQLLARLRLFRPTQGDSLIKKWLARLFSAAWSPIHLGIVLELLYTRCISVEILLDLSNQAPLASKCRDAIRELLVAGMLSQTTQERYDQHMYVVKIAAIGLLTDRPARALELLLSQNDLGLVMQDRCAYLLPRMLSDRSKLPALTGIANKNLVNVVDELLDKPQESKDALHQLLSYTERLSLPFCQFCVPALTSTVEPDSADESIEEKASSIYHGLRLNLDARSADPEVTQALLEAMPNDVQDRVRQMTEQQFFDSLPKFFNAKTISHPIQATPTEKLRSVEAMDKVVSLGPARPGSSYGDSNGIMIEKLTIVAKVLGAKNDVTLTTPTSLTTLSSPVSPAYQGANTMPPTPFIDNRYRDNILAVMEYLHMFLRMISMRASLFSGQANVSKATQNEQIKLIALLASISTQPSLAQLLQSNFEQHLKTKVRDCVSFALDVAARLADDLADEGRVLCTRILKDRLRDERIQWLVGSMSTLASITNTAGHGLVMMHNTKGYMGEFRPKQWELLESGGGKENDTCLGLGLFSATKV